MTVGSSKDSFQRRLEEMDRNFSGLEDNSMEWMPGSRKVSLGSLFTNVSLFFTFNNDHNKASLLSSYSMCACSLSTLAIMILILLDTEKNQNSLK